MKRLLLLVLAALFVMSVGYGKGETSKGSPPVITHSFAVEQGYYGDIWKIYIEAEDPDGDMLRVISVVQQAGYTRYPPDYIYLKSSEGKRFKGYLQWNTYGNASYLKEWTNITLNVSVFDKAGNESNQVVFPFSFESGVYEKAGPPPPFSKEDSRLGYIRIDLIEPSHQAGGSDRVD